MTVIVKTIVACDKCLSDTTGDVETTAELSLIFRLADREKDDSPYEHRLDLCANHASNVTVQDALQLGRQNRDSPELQETPPAHMRSRPQLPCLYCAGRYSAGSGMALHVKAKHPEQFKEGADWRAAPFT